MKVAVLGAGAREHALSARLASELGADSVFVSPGGDSVPGSFACDDADLVAALRERDVSLVLIGPEALLAQGLADRLRREGFAVLGPGEDDARLETSKAFAKDFMTRHRVARALSETVRGTSVARTMAQRALHEPCNQGIVLKYDGLAAGKGVFVCDTMDQVETALAHIEIAWGAGAELIVEERLRGRELSLVAFVAGGKARLFPPVEDHKQLLDGDRGPMTGGMGVYYPIASDGEELRERLRREIVEPTLRGMRTDHPDFRGIVFFGVMVTDAGPKLLEYNVRFGDPETQVLTFGMGESLADVCLATARGTLEPGWIGMRERAVVCVVLAAPGYPENAQLGVSFTCPAATTGTALYHAGSKRAGNGLVTAAGRVVSIVARGDSLESARAAAYAHVVASTGLHYRRDIGARRRA